MTKEMFTELHLDEYAPWFQNLRIWNTSFERWKYVEPENQEVYIMYLQVKIDGTDTKR